MPGWDEATLTERQRKWFASVREGLERDTGRPFEAWIEIARTCPETTPRARQKWMKDHHGLAQNRASLVLSAAFASPAEAHEADDPLWSDPAARAIMEAVKAVANTFPNCLIGRRKGYTPFSREYQFAAIRPAQGGTATLGLALDPAGSARLKPRERESWSERLKSKLDLSTSADVDADVEMLMWRAWEVS